MHTQTAFERQPDLEIVDVRDPEEWEAGHIEGSRHIPGHELPARIGELRSGAPVVTVCRTGRRSGAAVDVLRSLGIEADHVEGGLASWLEHGLPLVDGQGGPGTVAPSENHHGDHEHDGHEHGDDEHDGHGHGAIGAGVQHRVLELLGAAQEHFGDREPSEQEARRFFEQLLASEGLTPEEIEQILS